MNSHLIHSKDLSFRYLQWWFNTEKRVFNKTPSLKMTTPFNDHRAYGFQTWSPKRLDVKKGNFEMLNSVF